jgi:phage FluMu protein Com
MDRAFKGDFAMEKFRCRRCGRVIELQDFHGQKLVVCPQCKWHEVHPARRKIPKEWGHEAGRFFDVLHKHEEEAAKSIGRIAELPQADFEAFCAALFEQLGHDVRRADDAARDMYEFEVSRGNETALVRCQRHSPTHRVEQMEIENLAAAVRHKNADKGMYVTTATFTDDCTALAEQANIELVDTDELQRKIESADVLALSKWWTQPH